MGIVAAALQMVANLAYVGAAEGCDRTRSVRKPDNLIHLTHLTHRSA